MFMTFTVYFALVYVISQSRCCGSNETFFARLSAEIRSLDCSHVEETVTTADESTQASCRYIFVRISLFNCLQVRR